MIKRSVKITAEHLFELGDEQMSIKDSNKNKSQLNCYNCRKAKNILDLIDVSITVGFLIKLDDIDFIS